ncbi:P-loop containing nucleoside triphosphate hydrolase protein [Auriscalpium vulgare]|uniref:P-loop containing nucleoside triphosphate hydrolase protein n=1 Tax=Auriscalpium vulgare TaxID=40419 RepID=A0ACB8RA17_9AGAM|nr:P-loop containing nucleoside triphosphate hydrolase protein [Auriscalpium vulgare]
MTGAPLSQTEYAATTKALLQLVQRLTSIGAHAVLDVPRVVVIGNQSAGKSSVVEAISGITVPRDSGTCTRCPMECRMAYRKGTWSCQVSIRWEFDGTDRPLEEISEVQFGNEIHDKNLVELALRRAQFAVLHPDVEVDKVLSMSHKSLRKGIAGSVALPFSRNVVCVDLEGPDMTDLSFIDLPGLIQNEDDHLVKLVESLVVSHIQGNALILVTVPMTDDLENQRAMTLARQVDSKGKRTIGVLTKPDVISKGSRSRDLWMDVIEGRKHRLTHGYFCTRQPDDDERDKGITAEEARKFEETYFATNTPWSLSSKERFGIRNLSKTVSPLLAKIIKDTLPVLSKKTAQHLKLCSAELQALPEPIDDEPTEHMRNLITELFEQFNDHVRGNEGHTAMIQGSRTIFEKFKRRVRSTAPDYIPFLKKEYDQALRNDATRTNESGDVDMVDVPSRGHFTSPIEVVHQSELTNPRKRSRDESATESNHKKYKTLDGSKTLPVKPVGVGNSQVRPPVASNTNGNPSTARPQPETQEPYSDGSSEDSSEEEAPPGDKNNEEYEEDSDIASEREAEAEAELEAEAQGRDDDETDDDEADALEAGSPNQDGARVHQSIYLDDVRAQITGSITRELPNNVPFRAKEVLIREFQEEWTELAKTCLNDVRGVVTAVLRARVDEIFGRWLLLHSHMRSHVDALIQKRYQKTEAFIDGFLEAERSPFTLNGHYYQTCRDKWLSVYRGARAKKTIALMDVLHASGTKGFESSTIALAKNQRQPDDASKEEKQAVALAALASLGFQGLTAADLQMLHKPDEYDTEMMVMAEVRSYFQVSYKRIIDTIPMFIDTFFVKGIPVDLRIFLREQLCLTDESASSRCEYYFAEDDNTVARRQELLSQKTTLKAVKDELDNFSMSHKKQ